MADICELAEKWAREHAQANDLSDYGPGIEEELITAYLAGVCQTQGDYAKHYVGRCDCHCSNCSGCLGG